MNSTGVVKRISMEVDKPIMCSMVVYIRKCIQETHRPDLIANIYLVPKEDDKVYIQVDKVSGNAYSMYDIPGNSGISVDIINNPNDIGVLSQPYKSKFKYITTESFDNYYIIYPTEIFYHTSMITVLYEL